MQEKTCAKLLFCIIASSALLLLDHFEGAYADDSGFDGDLGTNGGTDGDTVEREAEANSYDGFSVKERQMMEASKESHQYEAEVGRLMGLIINSLYSNKEIFLREVISNASDALDKIRYFALTNPGVLGEGDQAKLQIKIKADPEAKSLTIEDSGVGMTKEDLIKNLGSIASSGTKRFVESLSGQDNADSAGLIGQFGVGFYSVFLVADEVTVVTKNNDDDQYVWVSDATGGYSLAKDPRGNTIGRGTRITLKLKDDAYEYLEEDHLKSLVAKYSEFINFPIYLWTTEEVEEEVDLTEEEIEEAKAAARAAKEEEEEEEDVSEDEDAVEEEDDIEVPTTKTVTRKVSDWTLINSSKPIWTRSKEDITEEEYNDFFKAMTKGTSDPMAYIHFSAEGEVEFRSILYIPDKAPQDLYTNYGQKSRNVKLFVRRVFITDDFEDILPKYLSFVRGMVDSDNLPLNVSREMLQQSKMLKTIKKKLTRKALEMIKNLTKEDEDGKSKYEKFWKEFGTAIKLGLIEDTANRTKIAKLLRFSSSKSGDGLTSLDEYVGRMKDKQKHIYYLAGEDLESVKQSPYLEVLLKRGLECLYLVDPVDEYAINSLPEFDGKKLMNVGKEGLEYEEEDEEEDAADVEAEYSELLTWLKLHLSDRIDKAVISKRLYTTPCALVSGSFGYTPNMERIVKAQALSDKDSTASFMMGSKKNMEINPRHPIVREMNRRVQEDAEDPVLEDLALMLYDTAALSSGYGLKDTTTFTQRIHKFMLQTLDLDPNLEAEKDEKLEAMAAEAEKEAAEAEAEENIDEHDEL